MEQCAPVGGSESTVSTEDDDRLIKTAEKFGATMKLEGDFRLEPFIEHLVFYLLGRDANQGHGVLLFGPAVP